MGWKREGTMAKYREGITLTHIFEGLPYLVAVILVRLYGKVRLYQVLQTLQVCRKVSTMFCFIDEDSGSLQYTPAIHTDNTR